VFLHGARTAADVIFADECARIAAGSPWLRYAVTLSQPSGAWKGACGRISAEFVMTEVPNILGSRVFLCGPNDFMENLKEWLQAAGMPDDRIHTEQFHKTPVKAVSP
jgi:NADH oxidoreductase Hcr